jgi:hypothetical protein
MAAITTPGALAGFLLTKVTFENLAGLDGQEFGFQAGQPYANLGLMIGAAAVAANANLASSSGGVAIRSETVYVEGNSNSLWLQFSSAQRAVGFYYRDSLATSVTLVARDANYNLVEQDTFPGGAGYAGLIRPNPDIAWVQVLAPHTSVDDAFQSRFYLDDLSFARNVLVVPEPPLPPIRHGNVVVVVGGIPVDGGGIVIGPQGVVPVPPSNPEFRQVAVAANLRAQAEHISDDPLREEVRKAASLLLKESIDRFLRRQ